jgi:hypothetical protein
VLFIQPAILFPSIGHVAVVGGKTLLRKDKQAKTCPIMGAAAQTTGRRWRRIEKTRLEESHAAVDLFNPFLRSFCQWSRL